MQYLNENDYYHTSDMALAATLCAHSYTIEAVDRGNSQKATFIIRRDDMLDGYVQRYFTQQLTVEPLNYFNTLKSLKSRLYHG